MNIFHQCLVRSGPFAGTGRLLAGLFPFLCRWPIVNQLRASGKELVQNYHHDYQKENKSDFSALFLQHYAELRHVAGSVCT